MNCLFGKLGTTLGFTVFETAYFPRERDRVKMPIVSIKSILSGLQKKII